MKKNLLYIFEILLSITLFIIGMYAEVWVPILWLEEEIIIFLFKIVFYGISFYILTHEICIHMEKKDSKTNYIPLLDEWKYMKTDDLTIQLNIILKLLKTITSIKFLIFCSVIFLFNPIYQMGNHIVDGAEIEIIIWVNTWISIIMVLVMWFFYFLKINVVRKKLNTIFSMIDSTINYYKNHTN